jgi:hypothetical protein
VEVVVALEVPLGVEEKVVVDVLVRVPEALAE